MLYKSKRKQMCRNLLMGGIMCLAGFTTFSCSDTYDLDTVQPSGLNTIYGYMKDKGNFKNFLHLIDDLGYSEVLAKTGSKTLFAADDDAFAQFYSNNEWGVSSYEQLSLAQKKLLLNSAMIDNPYPTSMLSTAEGPVKGEVCRRMSSQSIFDSVQVISTYSEELPQNERWTVLRSTHPEIVLFKDASGSQPMIHFTPKFLSANEVPSTDVDFLYNDPDGTRQSDDTYVNRAKIIETENCKNGFIHIVDRVIVPMDNMAEIIRKQSNMSIFSSILERFAAPKDSVALTLAYNQNKGTDVDSVYVKRYFSDRSWGSGTDMTSRRPFNKDKDGNTFNGSLKFDPGWNTFVPEIFNNRTPMMEDMAVMMVPTDEAMREWWDNGSGKVIKDYYGSIENTPSSVLDDLVNVNMLNSLVASVPSRFNTILNDANEPMGVTRDGINQVLLGCNGAIYETNKVYAPASYSSVLFPAVVDTENLNIIKNAIDNLEYAPYLNSMVSNYSFFIPTNEGLLTYVDPVSYGKTSSELWEFHYDETKSANQRVYADVYPCVKDESGKWVKSGERLRQEKTNMASGTTIGNRFEDILDNIIGVEGVTDGKQYVITKGKNFIKLGGTLNVAGQMTASGSWQVENDDPCVVKEIYNMENGKAFIVDGIITGTRYSVADILAMHPEFSEFYTTVVNSGCLGLLTTEGYGSVSRNKDLETRGNLITTSGTGSSQKVYSLFNAFHYTVYAPTNEAMQMAYAEGLPTAEQLAEAEAELEADPTEENEMKVEGIISVMKDFVRYHIQNNSIYLDQGFTPGNYESLRNKYEFLTNEQGDTLKTADGKYYRCTSGSPYRVSVTEVGPTGMTVRDARGNVRQVLTSGGLYNLQAREYWVNNGSDINKANQIVNSSTAVVQAINGPLFFDEKQFKYIPRRLEDIEFVKQRRK